MGGDDSQKLLPWREPLLSGAQTSGSITKSTLLLKAHLLRHHRIVGLERIGSVLSWDLLGVVDHQHFHRPRACFEPEPKLVL